VEVGAGRGSLRQRSEASRAVPECLCPPSSGGPLVSQPPRPSWQVWSYCAVMNWKEEEEEVKCFTPGPRPGNGRVAGRPPDSLDQEGTTFLDVHGAPRMTNHNNGGSQNAVRYCTYMQYNGAAQWRRSGQLIGTRHMGRIQVRILSVYYILFLDTAWQCTAVWYTAQCCSNGRPTRLRVV